jgi:hypothetical protein
MDPEKLKEALARSKAHQQKDGRSHAVKHGTFHEKTEAGQADRPESWKRSPPDGIFSTDHNEQNKNHYLDEQGNWITRKGFGPYRKDLETSGNKSFLRSIESLLRLYDFELEEYTQEGVRLTIHARSKE